MTSADILQAARACLGTPFRHQGRIKGVGLDCAGLAIEVARTIGCTVFDVVGYGRTPANGALEQALDEQPDLVRVPDIGARQPGDILLMRFSVAPQHLAILTDRDTMIHSYERPGMCCEHRMTKTWESRIVRVYRFAGVEE